MKSPQQGATNYAGSASRAQQAWVAGITSTQKDQAALAAAAQPRWLAGVQDAAANNRFANGVTRRGTNYWRSQSEAKAANFATGITAGQSNYASAAAKLYPAIQNIVNGLGPRGDILTNLDRSRQLALALHQAKGQYTAS